MFRPWLGFVAVSLSALYACTSSETPRAPITNVAAVWSVTSTYRDTTCPTPLSGTTAYTWMVSTDGADAYSISVTGETQFPKLTGSAKGDTLTVTAISDKYPREQAQWRLHLEQDALVGEEILSTTAETKDPGRLNVAFPTPCTAFFDVRATRQ
jgi:hypothetical protein